MGASLSVDSASKPDWIAVDWGTTHLRAWAMQGATPLSEAQSRDGMASLGPDEFEAALLRLIDPWLGTAQMPLIACGMVGARQGWVEAPYRAVPAKPADSDPVPAPAKDPRIKAWVIPGLKQVSPPDVMRGEETQIAGFLSLNPNWDGVVCLPGTHTKWAMVSAGEVVSFQSFMTGELFSLLKDQSVLRHSVAGPGWSESAFESAINDTMARPQQIAALLFDLRARDLLEGQPSEIAVARLSGVLIGAELVAARPYWLGQNLALIGSETTVKPYAAALGAQGVPVTRADGVRMTQAGLTAAMRRLRLLV